MTTQEPVGDMRRFSDLMDCRARAYWTARGLRRGDETQPCGCHPAEGHLCDRHLVDYEQFVFIGREPAWAHDAIAALERE